MSFQIFIIFVIFQSFKGFANAILFSSEEFYAKPIAALYEARIINGPGSYFATRNKKINLLTTTDGNQYVLIQV